MYKVGGDVIKLLPFCVCWFSIDLMRCICLCLSPSCCIALCRLPDCVLSVMSYLMILCNGLFKLMRDWRLMIIMSNSLLKLFYRDHFLKKLWRCNVSFCVHLLLRSALGLVL